MKTRKSTSQPAPPPVTPPAPIRPRYALFVAMLGIYVTIMGLLVWMRVIR